MNICFVGDYVPMKASSTQKLTAPSGCVVGNLECAFADGVIASGKAYTSVLPKSCMTNLETSGFAALSLANNHVNDAGNFDETYLELKSRFPNIQFFGTVETPYAVLDSSPGERVIVIGCLEPCRSRGKRIFRQEDVTALIKIIKQSNNPKIKQFIYVYPHWGKEGEYTRWPSPKQRKLAREWIDAGADGVIGNHAHIPQGQEWYQGKPIFYCLGNYDFLLGETDTYPASRERMIVKIDIDGILHREYGKCGERTCEASQCRWLNIEFDSITAKDAFKAVSSGLNDSWTIWRWAQEVGPIMLSKNMASWKIRLKKNFLKTLPKFLIWQCLPKVLLFRVVNLFSIVRK